MKKFKITYELPHTVVSQYMNLISHKDYINDIKPKQHDIYMLECQCYASKTKRKELSPKINELKSYLNKTYGDFFTDESPLYDAYINNTKLVLSNNQGNPVNVLFEQL